MNKSGEHSITPIVMNANEITAKYSVEGSPKLPEKEGGKG